MKSTRILTGLVFAAAAGLAHAQAAWPTKPITLVVPFAAGGPTDVVARTIGASMTKSLGQTVVIENKLGAGGTVAAAYAAKAAPDGYTFFIHHNGMATAPALYRKLSFNPLTDFAYVGQVADVPMTLLGRKDLPADGMANFIKYAKENGNKINLANAGLGAVSQLCGMLLQESLGVQFTTVPYAGTAPAMTALLARSAAISSGSSPLWRTAGMTTPPTAAMSASLEPDTPEKNAVAVMAIRPRPPRTRPNTRSSSSISRDDMPLDSISRPASTKNGIASRTK